MAAKIPENNQLYFYQLFSDKLGVGKQTFVTRVEEVLAEEDVAPLDLGAVTTRELLEGLASFVELKVFKGGRLYATVRPREDWDALLARAGKTDGKAQKGKPWKRAKTALKPVKPKRSKERLEAERKAAEEQEKAKRAAAEKRARKEAAARAAKEARDQAASAASRSESAGPDAQDGHAAPTAHNEAQPASRQTGEGAVSDAAAQPQEALRREKPAPAAESSGKRPERAEEKHAAPSEGQPSGISLTITYTPPEEPAARHDETAAPAMAVRPEHARQDEDPRASATGRAAAPASSPTASETEAAPANMVAPAEAEEPALFMPHPAPGAARETRAGARARSDYPRTISEDVYCRNAPLSMLTRILPYGIDLMAVLDEDWRVARATGTAGGTRNRITFPLRYLQEDGSAPVEVTLKRSQRPGTGARWELALVDGDDGTGSGHEAAGLEGLPQADEGAWSDLDVTASTALSTPYSPLRAFAQNVAIGSWDALLGELARIALPERWASRAKPALDARYDLLREYLTVTFARVTRQRLLEVSANGELAAFNTGLADSAYEDILLVLEATGQDIPWRFAGFAAAGTGELGRRVTAELSRIPEAPRYLTSLDEIVPDPAALRVLDYHALLGPCLGRLPRGFLTEMLTGAPGADELLSRLFDPAALPADKREALEKLSRLIEANAALRRRLCRALDDAADAAVRRCQRSYRTAAPVYDPRTDRMKMLLPLALVDDRTADCALVLDRQPSGAYQASSVLALSRAYACARVVSAEMPAWLSADKALG